MMSLKGEAQVWSEVTDDTLLVYPDQMIWFKQSKVHYFFFNNMSYVFYFSNLCYTTDCYMFILRFILRFRNQCYYQGGSNSCG